jgi:hypothetical protein
MARIWQSFVQSSVSGLQGWQGPHSKDVWVQRIVPFHIVWVAALEAVRFRTDVAQDVG